MRRWRWRRGIKNIEEGMIIKNVGGGKIIKLWIRKKEKIEEGNKIEKGEGYVKHCAQCKKKGWFAFF